MHDPMNSSRLDHSCDKCKSISLRNFKNRLEMKCFKSQRDQDETVDGRWSNSKSDFCFICLFLFFFILWYLEKWSSTWQIHWYFLPFIYKKLCRMSTKSICSLFRNPSNLIGFNLASESCTVLRLYYYCQIFILNFSVNDLLFAIFYNIELLFFDHVFKIMVRLISKITI